ncbi:MAG: DUF4153 domain-containing protein [Elusimicrobiota bacterium]
MIFKFLSYQSLQNLFYSSKKAFLRFPAPIVLSFVCAAIGVYLTEFRNHENPLYASLTQTLFVCILGISLTTGLTFLAEELKSKKASFYLPLFGLLLLFVFRCSYNEQRPLIYLHRFWIYMFASHLFVAFSKCLNKKSLDRFWQFNQDLFLKIPLTLIFSGVLSIGLCIALWAIDTLLGIHVAPRVYTSINLTVWFIFSTWFYLSELPNESDPAQEYLSYPSSLRIFSQYILIPLVTIYLLILFSYMGKILISQEWPKGLLGYLVTTVSVVGMLSLLLVHPLKNKPEYKWIRFYTRAFYWCLFPLCIMLSLALWKRVSDYGLTENRCYLILLSMWIFATAIYSTYKKDHNIKWIPISLCLIALLSSVGPWSVFNLSRLYQTHRLEMLLLKAGAWDMYTGKVKKTSQSIDFKDTKEISSVFDYLLNMHGVSSLQPLFSEKLPAAETQKYRHSIFHRPTNELAPKIMQMIGLTYANQWQQNEQFNFSSYDREMTPHLISGYDYLLPIYIYYRNQKSIKTSEPKNITCAINLSSNTIVVLISKDQISRKIEYDLSPFIETLKKDFGIQSGNVPKEKFWIETENKDMKIKILFYGISGKIEDKKTVIESLNGMAFFTLKSL